MWRRCQDTVKEELRKTNKLEIDTWKGTHKPSCKANHVGSAGSCKANHVGSAGSMETDGAIKIFQLSVEKHGVRYVSYYEDGDSKSYDEVKHIYPGTIVQKFECIGHYQKRVGNRLRKLRLRT